MKMVIFCHVSKKMVRFAREVSQKQDREEDERRAHLLQFFQWGLKYNYFKISD
jgi:hypothetical protein